MILRLLSIAVSIAAAYGLWWAYDELTVFRRTVFWEYRYIIFGVGALLALSLFESLIGWIKTKVTKDSDSH